jgi:hypothetical protein
MAAQPRIISFTANVEAKIMTASLRYVDSFVRIEETWIL